MQRVLIGTVGYHNLRDYSIGPKLLPERRAGETFGTCGNEAQSNEQRHARDAPAVETRLSAREDIRPSQGQETDLSFRRGLVFEIECVREPIGIVGLDAGVAGNGKQLGQIGPAHPGMDHEPLTPSLGKGDAKIGANGLSSSGLVGDGGAEQVSKKDQNAAPLLGSGPYDGTLEAAIGDPAALRRTDAFQALAAIADRC